MRRTAGCGPALKGRGVQKLELLGPLLSGPDNYPLIDNRKRIGSFICLCDADAASWPAVFCVCVFAFFSFFS
jgi:hypothetical protein